MVREPLEKALLKMNAPKTMIIHSDRGGQNLSDNIKKVVKTFELNQSMSRAVDPYDNATEESLWSRLKAELDMPKAGYKSVKELREILFEYFEYIEGFYNRQRLHSSLGYQSPQTFTENYYKKAG
jgi:transposase InsO family protein